MREEGSGSNMMSKSMFRKERRKSEREKFVFFFVIGIGSLRVVA